MPAIKIACDVRDSLPWKEVVPFQGELKTISEESLDSLCKEIMETGFAFPLHIWKNAGKFILLGGHQRLRALFILEQKGWKIAEVPVVYIHAKNETEARRRVLQDIGTYGKVNPQGLFDFMKLGGFTLEQLNSRHPLPDHDKVWFAEQFFPTRQETDEEGGLIGAGNHFGDGFKGTKLLQYLEKETCRILLTFSKAGYQTVVPYLERLQKKHKVGDFAAALVAESKLKKR